MPGGRMSPIHAMPDEPRFSAREYCFRKSQQREIPQPLKIRFQFQGQRESELSELNESTPSLTVAYLSKKITFPHQHLQMKIVSC
jgi:hypothetical protein